MRRDGKRVLRRRWLALVAGFWPFRSFGVGWTPATWRTIAARARTPGQALAALVAFLPARRGLPARTRKPDRRTRLVARSMFS